jgi:sec-independent protein translocase protein TatA
MLPDLGPAELIIILVIVLIIFGAGRLPGVFRALGQGIKEFREASRETSQDEKPKEQTQESKP